MSRLFPVLAVAMSVLPASAAPVPKSEVKEQIKLKDHVNVKMDENLHTDNYPNNDLKALKAGVQKLGDVTYEIGEGVLQLGSANVPGKPEKIEGIKVGRTVGKLHFLQNTGFSTEDGTTVGRYIVHYTDKTKVEVEIVYGKHVVDWWAYPGKAVPTEAMLAWEGENEAAKGFMAKVKLYTMTWTNPHPEKEIATLDFVAADVTQPCAPFCVAITAESVKEKKDEPKKDK
jgi:hypothetical protein